MEPLPEDCAQLLRPLRTLVGLRSAIAQWSDRHPDEHLGQVPVAAAGLLAELVHRGECRVTELAHHRAVDASVVSRQIAQLEHAEFLSRRPDPSDRRGCLVRATEAGAAEHRRLDVIKAAWLSRALSDWGEDDLRTLTSLLTAATEDIRRAAHAPPDRAQRGTG